MRKIVVRLTPFIPLAAGTALRLTRLGFQSEWNDEALSVTIAGGTTTQILSNAFHSLHPPGYYLLLHYWRVLVGDSDFALRLLSALLGILGIAAVFLLGKRLFGLEAAFWAGSITAFMPFHLFYSQEIRMYSLLFLLSTLAIVLQAAIWRTPRRALRYWLCYLVVSLAGLYTHYLFTLIAGALGIYFVLRSWVTKRGGGWHSFILTHAAMALLYVPIIFWLRDQWSQSSDYWISEASLAGFVSLPLSFTVGQFLDRELLMVGYGLIVTLLLISSLQAVRAIWTAQGEISGLILALLAYWVPVCSLFAVSLFLTPLTLPRLMMVAVPGLYVWLAWGAAQSREKRVNAALLVGLILIGLAADYNWLYTLRFHKPPAREAAYYLEEAVSGDEPVIFANDSGFRLFSRYAPGLDRRLYLDVEENDNPQVRPDVIRLMGGQILDPSVNMEESFWLVLHQDFEVDEQEQIYREFGRRYHELSVTDIGGIRLYRFQ